MTRALFAATLVSTLLLFGCHKRSSEEEGGAGESTSGTALVQTAAPTHQSLAEALVLYGEIAHDVGASENISFARPVLISKLLVSPGEPVRHGQPLLEVETDPTAATGYLQAQSAVAAAQREFKAQRELADERLTTQSQLAAARKALTDAEAALSAQRQIGAAPGMQVVRAARDGVVIAISVQQGNRVQAGTGALELSSSGRRRALLGAEPEDVSRLEAGMDVKLSPVFGGEPAAATIDQVFGVINPQTRLVDVAVRIPGAAPQLIPGMKVRGEVMLAATELWTLPRSAVLEDADGAYVFTVVNGHARRVKVRMEVERGELAGLRGNLAPNVPVVTLGNYELTDGMPVRVAPPASGSRK